MKQINEFQLRITGRASLDKKLELSHDYLIKANVNIISAKAKDTQENTLDEANSLIPPNKASKPSFVLPDGGGFVLYLYCYHIYIHLSILSHFFSNGVFC